MRPVDYTFSFSGIMWQSIFDIKIKDMKTYKKTLFALMALGLIMTINSCTKEDPSNPGSGGGDNDLPLELAQSDFQQDLVLKDRNDGVDYYINHR